MEDGVEAARLGADAIGLVFYPRSPRRVTPEQARAILDALPPFVTRVGLFVDPDPAWVWTVLAALPLDLLQFHGQEAADLCTAFDRPYIKAVQVRPDLDLAAFMAAHPRSQGFLLDAWHPRVPGGSGARFDWNLFPRGAGRPLILAGGLGPDNVAEAIRRTRPWAVDVSSGVEAVRGVKDAAAMAAFMAGVRRAYSEDSD